MLCMTVLDASRVAAVVQVVMKDGDTIYGTFLLSSHYTLVFLTDSKYVFVLFVTHVAASDSRKNGIASGY